MNDFDLCLEVVLPRSC